MLFEILKLPNSNDLSDYLGKDRGKDHIGRISPRLSSSSSQSMSTNRLILPVEESDQEDDKVISEMNLSKASTYSNKIFDKMQLDNALPLISSKKFEVTNFPYTSKEF